MAIIVPITFIIYSSQEQTSGMKFGRQEVGDFYKINSLG